MMRFWEWAVGALAIYAAGVAVAAFITWEVYVPLSTTLDRFWFLWCCLAAAGLMLADKPEGGE